MRPIEIETALSMKQQSAYGVKVPDLDMNVNFPYEGEGLIKPEYKNKNDAQTVGKGHEFAEGNTIPLTVSLQFSRKYTGDSVFIGWVVGLGFGMVTTTMLITGVYQHVFIPMPTTTTLQLPVTSLTEKSASYRNRVYRDLVLSEFKISGQLEEQITVDFTMIGSGYWETSTMAVFPELSPAHFLYTGDIVFSHGGTDISAKLKSFEASWKNGVNEKGYIPGSPKLTFGTKSYQCRGECLLKTKEAGLKWKMKMDSNDIETDMLEKNVKAVTILCEGEPIDETHNHSMKIEYGKIEIDKATVAVDNDEYVYDVEALVKFDRTNGTPIKITLINTQPTYLVKAA